MNMPRPWDRRLAGWMRLALLPLLLEFPSGVHAAVHFLRTPDHGIQPQAALDSQGDLHLIYYKGDPRAGNLFYTRRPAGRNDFIPPIRVNHRDGAAIAAGTIRGAQFALGRQGWIHVVWNGSGAVSTGTHMSSPLLYTRLKPNGQTIEPERDVITYARGLDGGSSVAADDAGNVYAVWHASPPDNKSGEAGRKVFLARSKDDGATFQTEIEASPADTGACGCCGLKALAEPNGALWVLYRAARQGSQRDAILMRSPAGGEGFSLIHTDAWQSPTCPMSSSSLNRSSAGILTAWETRGQVYAASWPSPPGQPPQVMRPPDTGQRKHPVAIANTAGAMLLVWVENSGWEKGGDLAWQLFDADHRPSEDSGRKPGVPVWSFATAVADAAGDFIVLY